MWPWILMSMRTYAPYITLPIAAVVGVIGYNIESVFRDPNPAQRPSTHDLRNDRLLEEMLKSKSEPSTPSDPRDKTIFDKNISPSLAK